MSADVGHSVVGKERGYRTARGHAVEPELTPAWSAGYTAPVADQKLGAAVDALMDRAVRTGALYERTEKMRVEGLGNNLEILLAPNRRAPGPEGPHNPGCGCPFCAPPNPDAKAVRWRGWDILPNAFPYARLHSQHLLAVSSTHVEQSFSPSILEDMLDLQQLLDGRNRTFHYNGRAGNSQPHLHWQITKERFPVERAIASSSKPVRTTHEGSVKKFDDGALAGVVVEGDKAFVVRMATAIVNALASDPLCKDRYNLLLLQGDRPRLVIIPRRADALAVDCGDGADTMSVVEAAGRYISVADAAPAGFTPAGYQAALRQTIVRPDELTWLDAVAGVPSDLRVRFRQLQPLPLL